MGRRLAQLANLPASELKGVGATKAASLGKMGIRSVLDVLMHYPRRYIDRTKEAKIADLEVGEEAAILVNVKRSTQRRTGKGKSMVIVTVTDGTASMDVTFFGQPFREKQLQPGLDAVFFGKLELYGGKRKMTNPVVDLIGNRTGRDGIPDIDFYVAYNMFRLAGIIHGIKGRVIRGTATSAHAKKSAEGFEALADLAWAQAQKLGAK